MEEKHITVRKYEEGEFISEYLEVLPIDIMDSAYNHVNIEAYHLLDSFKQYLMSYGDKIHSTADKEEYINKCFPLFETYIETTIDKVFNVFQQYFLDSILHIPSNKNVTLPYYREMNLSLTKEDNDSIDIELEKARAEVISQMAFRAWLEKEEQHLDRHIKIQQEYRQRLDGIILLSKKHNVPSLDDALTNAARDVHELESQVKAQIDHVFQQGALDTLETEEKLVHKEALSLETYVQIVGFSK